MTTNTLDYSSELRGIFEQLRDLNKILLKIAEIQLSKKQFEDWKNSEGLGEI